MQRSVAPDDEAGARPQVEVRRSAKRKRTVSAHREGDVTVVLIPARMSRADERRWVEVMLKRLDTQDRRRKPSDTDLFERAVELSRRHLGGQAKPTTVRWVTNQVSRWGSCTPADGSIRLSHRLQDMPRWVTEYVLVHELAHLLVADHSPEFWELVGRYPRSERARGYLDGYATAAGLEPAESGADDDDVMTSSPQVPEEVDARPVAQPAAQPAAGRRPAPLSPGEPLW